VFTHTSSPVLIKMGTVKVGATTYADKTATFDMPLVAGKKYTLGIDFKRNLVWAGSNIYWTDADGGKLTFDAPTTDVNTQRKQGVFFKRGLLIGFAPDRDYRPLTYYAYGPTYTSSTNHTWAKGINLYSAAYFSTNQWEELPSLKSSNFSSGDTEEDWKSRLGDICRYISENGYGPGGAYRTPTRQEWGDKSTYVFGSDGWTLTGPATAESGNAEGTYLVNSYISNSGVVFPLSGQLWMSAQYHGANIDGVGSRMYYFDSTGSGMASATDDYNNYDRISTRMSYSLRPDGYSVRCVRNN
jgi:hypothetical protein